MNRNTLVFIVLICVLFIGHLLINEGFVDSSVPSQPIEDKTAILVAYQLSLWFLPNLVYNQTQQYKINSKILYNGSLWSNLQEGTGSSLGIPTPTNSKWQQISIDAIVNYGVNNFNANIDASLVSSLKQMQGSDLTPVYNVIIKSLMYDPTYKGPVGMFCIYNGNMWIPSSKSKMSENELGTPSLSNPNWQIFNTQYSSEIDPLAKQLIQNTGQGVQPILSAPIPAEPIPLIFYQMALGSNFSDNLSNSLYNPNTQYRVGRPILNSGSLWSALHEGSGSSLGIPSDTNSNWQRISIDMVAKMYAILFNIIIDQNIVSALKGLQGSDFTNIYNAIINRLIYNPADMYSAMNACIYNGNMWFPSPDSPLLKVKPGSGLPSVSGSTLGIPSVSNSNWKIFNINDNNLDPFAKQAIQNTAQLPPASSAPTAAIPPVSSAPTAAIPPAKMPLQGISGRTTTGPYGAAIDAQFMDSLRADIKNDISTAIKDSLSSPNVMTDSCIDNVSNAQGADFMRYIPGKNPADYIRKDSIPCYGCSVP